jgi:hypothetical protein
MKETNKTLGSMLIGLSGGLLAWFFLEIILMMLGGINTPPVIIAACVGAATGFSFGVVLPLSNVLFANSFVKWRETVKLSMVLGIIGGTISFSLVELASKHVPIFTHSNFLADTLTAQRWVVLAIAIGISNGLRERRTRKMVRGFIGGLIAGVIGSFLIFLVMQHMESTFLAHGVSMLIFGIVYAISMDKANNVGMKTWIKVLNGKLTGISFELSDSIHFLGSHPADDINLIDYKEISQTHAKIVMYDHMYSILDNDPFNRTWVNFRPAHEQPLKNGDIIKIGTALFQFCVKPVKVAQV